MSVGEALERIRREGVGERVIYFYAIDEEKRLVGVVPTRRLLTAPLETALREVMVRRVVAVPAKATVLDACEFFVLYKFLAFPGRGRTTPRGWNHRRELVCRGNFGSRRYSGSIPQQRDCAGRSGVF
jgi:Mg/Co/Ni transporter MgtE (contains CBS domain)